MGKTNENKPCRAKCTPQSPCPERATCPEKCEYCCSGCTERCPVDFGPTEPVESIETVSCACCGREDTCWNWVLSAQGMIMASSNDCRELLGWQSWELEGTNGFGLVPKIEREKAMLDFQRAVQTRRPAILKAECRDGQFVDLEYTVEPVVCKATGAVVAFKGQSYLAKETKLPPLPRRPSHNDP